MMEGGLGLGWGMGWGACGWVWIAGYGNYEVSLEVRLYGGWIDAARDVGLIESGNGCKESVGLVSMASLFLVGTYLAVLSL